MGCARLQHFSLGLGMSLRLRVRHRAGQEQFSLDTESTLGSFVSLVSEKTGIPAKRIKLKFGYPPKAVVDGKAEATLGSIFPSGEAVIVEESDEPSVHVEVAAPTSAPQVERPQAPSVPPPVNSSGAGVRRVVDADNSCLFTSIGYVLLGKDRKAGMPLRDVVAKEILADPDAYNEAVLEKEPAAYAEWIQGKDHWGGAIELRVLSDHFSCLIVAWDIQTARPARFGEEKGFKQCVHLVYDGLHYDAMALVMEGAPPESEDFDITVFSPDDSYMEAQAKAVVLKLKEAKLYTDTKSFTLRCLVCQKGLVGEADAVDHAKQTGHQNFAEYK